MTVVFTSYLSKLIALASHKRQGVLNHQQLDYLINIFFRRTSRKPPQLPDTGTCAGNKRVLGGFLTGANGISAGSFTRASGFSS